MFKDYYAILDIALDSDSLTIKKAYRMMSIRWHPDKIQIQIRLNR